jgi:hypothetical protein
MACFETCIYSGKRPWPPAFWRGDLDLQAKAGCGGGQSLVDYNPSAGTSTVLLGPPVNGGGVIAAVPYSGQR